MTSEQRKRPILKKILSFVAFCFKIDCEFYHSNEWHSLKTAALEYIWAFYEYRFKHLPSLLRVPAREWTPCYVLKLSKSFIYKRIKCSNVCCFTTKGKQSKVKKKKYGEKNYIRSEWMHGTQHSFLRIVAKFVD